ncbi:heme utilization protein [Pseudomonas sp. RA_35y_Pfl2_P32]|uniref:heme utilization protein n=1 Tax=Pseudomonas sp. RA_35y_Pfl2_P32 TaxID=3088705 RepID=UPI0030D99E5A
MKPTTALKPLVFALAAVMAMAAQADGGKRHYPPKPQGPTLDQILSITAGAGAAVIDQQDSSYNSVLNQGTKNTSKADSSLNGSSGNMGANVAAGDGNQQDNVAAIATADEKFIFGSAVAISSATQNNTDNSVTNRSTQNLATVNNVGNGSSGNIGVNSAAGNFNQQKNNLAIAVSAGRVATAAAAANQTSTGLDVDNKADRVTKVVDLKGSFKAHGSYKGTGYGTIEGDKKGHDDYRHGGGGKDKDQKFTFKEQGSIELAGYWTQQVLTKDGWKNPVVNNASMTNSMNGFSGNGGTNVAAGVGNQQSNSLSIAAGCRACPGGNSF